MQALFEHAMDFGLPDKKSREVFMDLWNETFEDLDKKARSLVLFQMKLSAERRFEDTKGFLTREYEEMRFKNRDDYERIVVEGSCKRCGTGPAVLPYLEYRKRFAAVAPYGSIKLDCRTCNTKGSLIIPNFNL